MAWVVILHHFILNYWLLNSHSFIHSGLFAFFSLIRLSIAIKLHARRWCNILQELILLLLFAWFQVNCECSNWLFIINEWPIQLLQYDVFYFSIRQHFTINWITFQERWSRKSLSLCLMPLNVYNFLRPNGSLLAVRAPLSWINAPTNQRSAHTYSQKCSVNARG